MTEIVITPPETITITATSPTAYTITVTQPAAVTVTAALGASGTVTSIATTAPITGGTITGSGTIGISAATTAAAGSMSAGDKTKLDGIESGAEVNNISDVNATDLTDGGNTILHSHANDHARQHAITSTSDHTSAATSGQMLKADANGLPVNATNTDAQVSAAVTASHAAVTVADTTSIDLTLTGQQVSAAAIFGTSAGVVAEGNHTHSYQPLDTELTAIAGLTSAADRLPYFTGAGTASLATFTAAGRAIVDDADAAAQRTTLGAAGLADANIFTASQKVRSAASSADILTEWMATDQYGRFVFLENTAIVGEFSFVGSTFATTALRNQMRFQNYVNNAGVIAFATRTSSVNTDRIVIGNGGFIAIGSHTPTFKLHTSGGQDSTTFTVAQIALGYSTTGQYPHFIHTRHNGSATNNAIDFYTGNGTAAGNYPTTATHGLTINNGSVGLNGVTSPTSVFDIGAGSVTMAEMTAPAAPAANGGRIFLQDNGAGKTQLMIIFASGAAQQIAIQP